MDNKASILTVENLKVYFPVKKSLSQMVFGAEQKYVKAVDGVSFSIEKGKTLAVVGESGCGKTTLGRTIVHLNKPISGEISYDGIDIARDEAWKNKELRKEIQYIFRFYVNLYIKTEKPTGPADRTLVLGMETEPVTLNSHANGSNYVLQMGHLYGGFLTSLNKVNGGEIQPAVAESWTYKSNTELVLQIRDDVYWHNGRQLVPEDIVFTFDWVIDEKNASSRRSDIAANVDHAEKTGDWEVTLFLKNPYPALLELLSYVVLIAEDTVGTLDTAPIGCGPYKFVSWEKGLQVNFEPFDLYYGWEDYNSLTYNKLAVRTFQDYNALMTAFFADEVDIMLFVATSDLAAIEGRGYKTQSIIDSGTYVACNTAKDKLNNPKVREAIKYAIDKQELIDLANNGVGEAISQMYPKTNPFYNPDLDWDHDLERAKQALIDAGYPKGLDLEILTPNTAARIAVATVLQQQLEKAGFRITINSMENAAMLTTFTEGKAELGIGGFGFYADPSLRMTFIDSARNKTWTRYGYDNAEYNELYEQSVQSTDFATRYELYSKLSEKAIDEAGFFMLMGVSSNCAMKKNIEGVIYRGSGNSDFTHVYFN